MIVYNNQKLVCYHTDFTKWSDEKQMYFKSGYDNISNAIKTLSHRGLKLYLYLAKNKDGEWFPLSSVDVEKYTGMKENTYSQAVAELEEKGYLTKTEKPIFFEAGNKTVDYYIFSVCPATSAAVSPANDGETTSAAVSPANDGETTSAAVSPANDGETTSAAVSPAIGCFDCMMKRKKIIAYLNDIARRRYHTDYTPELEIDKTDLILELSRDHILLDDDWIQEIDNLLPKEDGLPF